MNGHDDNRQAGSALCTRRGSLRQHALSLIDAATANVINRNVNRSVKRAPFAARKADTDLGCTSSGPPSVARSHL